MVRRHKLRTCRWRAGGDALGCFGVVAGVTFLLAGCRVERHPLADKEVPSSSPPFHLANSGAKNAQGGAERSPATATDSQAEPDSGAAGAPASNLDRKDDAIEPAPKIAPPPTADQSAASGSEPTEPSGDAAPPPDIPEGWELFVFAGGTTLSPEIKDYARKAVGHGAPTEIAANIVARLEALTQTNAGPGSALRLDGETIEASALLVDGKGHRAAVGGLRTTLEPISLAESLFRAGGGTIWGPAADELAVRFQLKQGSLEVARARADYLQDLSHAVQTGLSKKVGSLFSLYVTPEALTQSLIVRGRSRDAANSTRLPVFALVISPDNESGFAISHGGEPLAIPGSRPEMDNAVALSAQSAVIVLSGDGACDKSAGQILERFRMTRSLSLSAQSLEADCPSTNYLLLSREGHQSNLNAESVFQLSGRAEPVVSSPAPQRLAAPPAVAPLRAPAVSNPSPLRLPVPATSPAPARTTSPGTQVPPSSVKSPPPAPRSREVLP